MIKGRSAQVACLLRDVIVRGLALFFGVFSLVNSAGSLLRTNYDQDIWWIDLSFLPRWLAVVLSAAAAVVLIAWAVAPAARARRRAVTLLLSGTFAVFAAMNVVGFYRAWHAGSIVPQVVVPASVLWAAAFVWIARPALRTRAELDRRGALPFVVVAALVCALLFPLAQMAFFGTTDYRRPADVAVVLGAKVTADGSLSTALEDRVRTAVDLYKAGLVSRLIMSGGVGESGFDETIAMRNRAV
jgi:hypothetical protein